VIKPDVLLMDEPLSNLDAKLRLEMRQVIRDIQKDVGITTVYVTHDQEEAMAISDRIAVMHDGEIQHVGTPQEIYHRPSNMFVASFIGRTNFLNARYRSNKKLLEFGEYSFAAENISPKEDCPVVLSVRPEDFIIHNDNDLPLKGVIKDSFFLGLNTLQLVELSHNQQLVEIIRESSLENRLTPGEKVSLSIKSQKINIYSEDSKQNLISKG
jgi:iron(III) transport system ATP-binding protein